MLILTLIFISTIDNKGKIIANPFREGNPRMPYEEIENKKFVDLIKKSEKLEGE